MPTDPTANVEALLAEAKEAHSEFEATVLNGVYDQDWPSWYASYAVEHGISTLVGRQVNAAELAEFFVRAWDEAHRADIPAAEAWETHTARLLVSELSR
jgi:hypothetical protein